MNFNLNFGLKSKWKASKTPVTAINVDPTSKFLASASRTITIWDTETKTKLKVQF